MIYTARLVAKGGDGGSGCVSFRREKFVPRGGPDGGDGGHGGSVFVAGDQSLNTLQHLSYNQIWKAKRGLNGSGQNRRGSNGDDLTVRVPYGTVIWHVSGNNKELLADIIGDDRVVVARGGKGGAGNARFVSSVNQEPVLAEKGGKAEEAVLDLELKLLADVGIIGRPNAGKSTLLSRCSAAKPKIANYPFTTIDPVLGVVVRGGKDFVMMEIPGLIEGAHQGAGLGDQFLRHAERVRLLIHLLDGLSEDPIQELKAINEEMNSFSPSLAQKPQLIVVNKNDVTEVKEREKSLTSRLKKLGLPVLSISAVTGEGVDSLLAKTMEALDNLPKEGKLQKSVVIHKATPKVGKAFTISRENGVYVVHSSKVERLMPSANMQDWRARIQIWKELDRLGIVHALEERGIQQGDTVRLGEVELEWF